MSAPLSPDELAVVDRFDAGPDAPESLRERVAEACYEITEYAEYAEWPEAAGGPGSVFAYALADAAIAVITGGQS